MLTAQEVYIAARTLSLPERLRLAALLLDELDQPALPSTELASLTGYSDAWTEEDVRDFRLYAAHSFNLTHAMPDMEQDAALPPQEDLLKLQMEQSR